MTRIPIDMAAPIACTINSAKIPVRVEQIDRMRDDLEAIERTTTGLHLQFKPSPDLESLLEQFVMQEKGCCQFWGFELDISPTLNLRWSGPPGAQAILDELHRYFTSDEPLAAFSGLL